MSSRSTSASVLALLLAGLLGATACTAGSGSSSKKNAATGDDDDDDTAAKKKKSSSSSSSGDDDDDTTGDDTAGSSTCSYPAAQGPTEPCCPDLGIDACGAKLFCAALEGRKVAVCYAEGSLKSGEACTEDRQCSASTCTNKKCAYAEGESCTGPTDACIGFDIKSGVVCSHYGSATDHATYKCTRVGTYGQSCKACSTIADCGAGPGGGATTACTENTCLYTYEGKAYCY